MLEVTGTITRIQSGSGGLFASKPRLYLGRIECIFQDDSLIKQLTTGQQVTIRGKCKGGKVIEYCMLR